MWKEVLNEHKELFDNNNKQLRQQEDLLHEREQLLPMSSQQLNKIQDLEKQLEEVKGHPRTINIKQTPVFIQIPDTKTHFKHFERISEWSHPKSLCENGSSSHTKNTVFNRSTPYFDQDDKSPDLSLGVLNLTFGIVLQFSKI